MMEKGKRKVVKRGKTQRFRLNEEFIFGAPRCMRCRKVLKDGEDFICRSCEATNIFG